MYRLYYLSLFISNPLNNLFFNKILTLLQDCIKHCINRLWITKSSKNTSYYQAMCILYWKLRLKKYMGQGIQEWTK